MASQAVLELLIQLKDQASSGLASLGGALQSVGGIALGVTAGGIAAVSAALVAGVADAREANQVMAQTETVIRSTGGAAGFTAQQVADMATKLSAAQGASLFGDADIQRGENLLLTFTNIREVLPETTQVMVDMAQALGTDVAGGAVQLGKALNDPIKGITALTRVGVTFTDQQKQQIETMMRAGDVAGAQRVILAELNKEFGGSAAAAARADGGWAQFRDRLGEAAETAGGALLPLLNQLASFLNSRVAPAVEAAAAKFAAIVPVLAGVARDAYQWGVNLAQQFGAGIASAASYVISIVQQLGALIASWLRPGSPPKILPEIDQWGQQTAETWISGFGQADLSGIEELGRAVQDTLRGLVKAGQGDEQGIIPAVLGSRDAMARAIAQADQFGSVSEDAIQQVISAAGAAGPQVTGLVRNFFDLRRATQDVKNAQAELNRVTQEYASRLAPLNAELKQIEDQKQAIDDQIRIRDLQEEIADGKTDDLTRQKDLLEIQEIQKRAQIRAIEDERDAATGVAQQQLDAAEAAQQAAQDRQRDAQAQLSSYNQQNQLIGQQIDLLKQLADAAKPAGGGGGGGGPALPAVPSAPAGPALPDIATPLADASAAVAEFEAKISTVGATITATFAPLGDLLAPLVSTFRDAENPIIGFLDVLSQVSPGFALLRSAVEAALPPVQSIVASVFGIIGGLIRDHGATIVGDISSAWGQIQTVLNGLIPPIQSIVETVFGAIAQFLDDHGAEIQALLAKAWDTIALVVDAALKLINATVVPAFQSIASFLSSHSAEIQQILSGAWAIISGVIDAALTIIQGVITAALQIIQGDFSGAWQTIQEMNEQVWADIQQVLSGAWEIIKGLVTSGIDAVVGQFTDMPGQVAGVGEAMIDQIWQGLKAEWQKVMDWLHDRLQEFRDMLPGSEPRDSSSPLHGLAQAGAAIVSQITHGLTANGSTLTSSMAALGSSGVIDLLNSVQSMIPDITQAINELTTALQEAMQNMDDESAAEMQDLVDHLSDIASSLGDRVSAAIADAYETMAGGFDASAAIDRQRARNLAALNDLSSDMQSYVQQQFAEAERLAQRYSDPKQRADFFRQRSQQILELAKLRDQLSQTSDAAQRANIEGQIRAIESAQAAEQRAFDARVAGQAAAPQQASPLQQLASQIQDLFNSIRNAGPSSSLNSLMSSLSSLMSQIMSAAGATGTPVYLSTPSSVGSSSGSGSGSGQSLTGGSSGSSGGVTLQAGAVVVQVQRATEQEARRLAEMTIQEIDRRRRGRGS